MDHVHHHGSIDWAVDCSGALQILADLLRYPSIRARPRIDSILSRTKFPHVRFEPSVVYRSTIRMLINMPMIDGSNDVVHGRGEGHARPGCTGGA